MTTRVLLSDGIPRILRDLVIGLVRDAEGLEVGDQAFSNRQLAACADADGAQIVIFFRASPELPDWASELLVRHPRLRFLGLDDDGRSAVLYQLGLEQRHLEEISPDTLVAVLHEPWRGVEQWMSC